MPENFSDLIAQWNPFFTAVSAVAATLVGLLFVSLGLNPAIIAGRGPSGFRTTAGQAFHGFIVVLVISLIALTPNDDRTTMVITLAIIGAQGVYRVIRDVGRMSADPDPQWGGRNAWLRVLSPAMGYLISLWLSFQLWQRQDDQLGWLIGIVFFLMMSALASCWDLMIAVGARELREQSGQNAATPDRA